MGRTYKDQSKYDQKKKFPRVPPITKRSEAFEDRRRKEKYPTDPLEDYREDLAADTVDADDDTEV